MADNSVAIGIDLGTTNSCVAVFRNGKAEIIKNDRDINITPSMVSFGDTQKLVGADARDQELINFKNTVFGIKRLIGRSFTDPAIQQDIKRWPFKVVSDNGKPAIKVKYMGTDQMFHPEVVSAMVLEHMKSIAESYLGQTVKDAVITVPAYFDNNQRQATKNAGKIAGLNVLRLMNEPTAAAVAYGLDKQGQRNILVYDLGGGTFDISVLSMQGATFHVKAIKGNTHLGGDDFDNRMVDHFAKEIMVKHGKDIFKDTRALRRLATQCEKAKVKLSFSPQMHFDIPSLIDGIDCEFSITRKTFEEICQDLFDETLRTVEQTIADSQLPMSSIDDVVLVGGSTRIPKVEAMLKNFFNKKRLNKDINPDEAVAFGAAVQAAQLAGDSSRQLKDLQLYDVVPLSLGIEVQGGIMSTIIDRNKPIPISRSRNYTTTVDNQTKMRITVYEGERALTKDNELLGEMILEGIPPEPRGYASVVVLLDIDDDCILNVKAKDQDSGSEKNVQIINNNRRLTQDQLEALIQQAEQNRVVDHMNALRIHAMNDLEAYIHDIRSSLNREDFEQNMRPREREQVLRECNAVSTWLETGAGKNAQQNVYKEKQAQLEVTWNPIVTQRMESSRGSIIGNRPVVYLGD